MMSDAAFESMKDAEGWARENASSAAYADLEEKDLEGSSFEIEYANGDTEEVSGTAFDFGSQGCRYPGWSQITRYWDPSPWENNPVENCREEVYEENPKAYYLEVHFPDGTTKKLRAEDWVSPKDGTQYLIIDYGNDTVLELTQADYTEAFKAYTEVYKVYRDRREQLCNNTWKEVA